MPRWELLLAVVSHGILHPMIPMLNGVVVTPSRETADEGGEDFL